MAARKPAPRTIGEATEVLPFGTDRDAWLAQRRLGIGGSDVSAIFGLSRFSTARRTYLEKIGADTDDISGRWPIMRGNLLEPGLIAWFEREHNVPVTRFGTLHNPAYPWLQYNPDGIIEGEPALLECKTTGFWARDEWSDDQTADHAELQVQAGLAVTGFDKAYVIVGISDDDPTIREVHRDPALIDLIATTTERFWHEHVLTRVEPPVTYLDLSTVKAANRIVKPGTPVAGGPEADDAVKRYQHAGKTIRDYQQIKDAAHAEILLALGSGSELVINGEIAARRSTSERAGYTVQPTTSTRLTVPTNRKPYKAGI